MILLNHDCKYSLEIRVAMILILFEFIVTTTMPVDHQAQYARRQQLRQFTILVVTAILAAAASVLQALYPRDPLPYHTSILTGAGWVSELINGHPERIHCELGVHLHVFQSLLSELRNLGYRNSRFVTLEEQLAIFLYSCVTGLTICHIGERFQRSNGTISW
jgi:hypothetical protein